MNWIMIRKILKYLALTIVALVFTAGVLYVVGLRVVLDGGGTPHLVFVSSERARLKRIAESREAQRLPTTPQPAPAAEPATNPPPTAVTPGVAAPPSPGMPASPPYWTDFRGPLRDGRYRERPVRADWPREGLRPLWRQPIGGGYASFVVARGRAFTIEQRGGEEVVAAYDPVTGRELWTNAWTAAFREMMGGDGPRATPTWFDGRVYALGAQGELRCLDEVTGHVVWRTNILEDAGAKNLQWGMAASPLIVDDTVVVLPGGSGGRSVAAYDRRSGKHAWSALDDQAGYSSPMLVTLAGVRQILVFTGSRMAGITPDRGELLWEYPWTTQFGVNASQPLLVGDNRVFVSTGYGTGAGLVEIARNGDTLVPREVWRSNRMKNQFSSSVLHDGFIYGLDEAILACLDATTGDLKWKGGRYGYGQVMLAGDRLIVLSEQGDLALVRATPEKHDELARFAVLEGKTWNYPAMSGGYLLLRNINEMVAFDLRPRVP